MKLSYSGILILLLLLLSALAACALTAGAGAQAGWRELWQGLTGSGWTTTAWTIFFELRLPRIGAAILTGALLAMAGGTLQALFRNPLASPHILGTVNASALGAVGGMLLCGAPHPVGAFLCGIGVTLLLLLPGRLRRDFSSLLLAGIAVNALTAAAVSGLLFIADERLQGVVFWLLGGFWRIAPGETTALAVTAALGGLLLFKWSPELDLLSLGGATAQLSGMRLALLEPLLAATAAGMVAMAVSVSGVIGFVGLLIPHGAALLVRGGFRRRLPVTALLGALLLLGADTLARLAAAPLELPVGIITALIGAPFFLGLLWREAGKRIGR